MPIHRNLQGERIHKPYAYEYANQAERESATGFAIVDEGKLARQLDDDSLWMLTDWEANTWVAVGSGSGGSTAINGYAEVLVNNSMELLFDEDGDVLSEIIE